MSSSNVHIYGTDLGEKLVSYRSNGSSRASSLAEEA